jgi:MFS family permease
MQTVGAQWLLVHQAHAAILVPLVQTADMLPYVLFGLVGGVLADTFDRRRLLVAVQCGMVVVGAVLTVLTVAHQMPPALLLMFTFVLGSGSVLAVPAYQSLVPDLVPRDQVRAASTLSSVSINLARAVGPAIAGVLIARTGVAAVFAINTATFLFYAVVVLAWHPQPGSAPEYPERFVSALRAGGRYVRNAPVIRRVLLRAALFLVPGSALWALLALVASRTLGLGPGGYGLLLAALGAGAVGGALVLPRARLSSNALLATASVIYAAAMAAVVLVHNVAVTVIVLLPAGMAWIAVLSSVNAALQLFLPGWVRARGLSVYQIVLFGAQAAGAAGWGVVAGTAGLVPAFVAAAIMMAAGAATIRFWPFLDTADMDRSPVSYWPDPHLVLDADPRSGPVVVQNTYTVAAANEQRFLQAMAQVRRSRLRTGAVQWGLFQDGENPRVFIELFVVPSWEEHLRQHTDRLTGTDRQYEEAAKVLSDPPVTTAHLIAADVPRGA